MFQFENSSKESLPIQFQSTSTTMTLILNSQCDKRRKIPAKNRDRLAQNQRLVLKHGFPDWKIFIKGIGSAKLPRKVKKNEMLKKVSQSTVEKRCNLPSRSQRERQLAARENLLDTSDSSQINFEPSKSKYRIEADSDDIFD